MRALLLVIAVLAGGWTAPPDVSGLEFVQRPGAVVPLDAGFRDQGGRGVTLREVMGGRAAVLQLGYFACPALCGVVRDDVWAGLAASGLVAGRDYAAVFVSIDPAETPRDAAAFQARKIAGEGVYLLTGQASGVAEAAGFRSRFDAGLKQFVHPGGAVVLTGDGRISSYLLGVGYGAAAVREAVLRAGAGEVSGTASPVLLLCFHYDEVTGRYTLAVMKVLRLAAILTVLTGVGVFWAVRRAGVGVGR